jgi:hypothetical protein
LYIDKLYKPVTDELIVSASKDVVTTHRSSASKRGFNPELL